MASDSPTRIMAIASGGGHWVQLNRLHPAFEGCEVTYVSVDKAYREDVIGERFIAVPDATRWNKFRLTWMALSVGLALLRVRPHVIISTGAAPGYVAIWLGSKLGARTLWLDSIANVERISMSGQMIRRHVDLCLTQWPHLAEEGGPVYWGAVL